LAALSGEGDQGERWRRSSLERAAPAPALVWAQRGWAPSAQVPRDSPVRPDGDDAVLTTLLARLDETVAACQ
jgi:hypothetical protein